MSCIFLLAPSMESTPATMLLDLPTELILKVLERVAQLHGPQDLLACRRACKKLSILANHRTVSFALFRASFDICEHHKFQKCLLSEFKDRWLALRFGDALEDSIKSRFGHLHGLPGPDWPPFPLDIWRSDEMTNLDEALHNVHTMAAENKGKNLQRLAGWMFPLRFVMYCTKAMEFDMSGRLLLLGREWYPRAQSSFYLMVNTDHALFDSNGAFPFPSIFPPAPPALMPNSHLPNALTLAEEYQLRTLYQLVSLDAAARPQLSQLIQCPVPRGSTKSNIKDIQPWLAGSWKGYYVYNGPEEDWGIDEPMTMNLLSAASRSRPGDIDIWGSGQDAIGDFTINGILYIDEARVRLIKRYTALNYHWVYHGAILEVGIAGLWGQEVASGTFWIWKAKEGAGTQ
ncbi:hypothetical protein DFJ77DRAFT_465815 [Powellomyces hirtus]|nr:hypothetical protein DFJ77DRAFT_465815 [Powellomyces hirtus]